MDVLTDILSGLRASGSVYFCDFLAAPWELRYANEPRAMFHLVRHGRCRLEFDGEAHEFESGDFAFVAPGVDHALSSGGFRSGKTLLLCGYCQFDALDADVLLRTLPNRVLMRREELEQWPWLARTLEHVSAEYMSPAPGSELTVNKLTEVLLVQLLRADFGRKGATGLIAALRDRRVARALTAVHAHPGRPWTTGTAASEAAMSRSGFARRFSELLGTGFFDYLTRVRMLRARELLATTDLPVASIGERLGYRSDLSFVKAFKRRYGQTPTAFRQHAGPTESTRARGTTTEFSAEGSQPPVHLERRRS